MAKSHNTTTINTTLNTEILIEIKYMIIWTNWIRCSMYKDNIVS